MGVVSYMMKGWLLGMVLLSLTACGGREDLAPVVEPHWRGAKTHAKQHVVKRGDTLYAIAFRYDTDYRELASFNHLYSPYSLRVGQIIRIQSGYHSTRTLARPSLAHTQVEQTVFVHQPTYPRRFIGRSNGWMWPAHGRVVANFVPDQGKKGVDIAGKKGDKIYAAKNGTVAYAGSGLPGYGNLIIVKHDNQFLTAYGNNSRNLVREGQVIKAGQVIADMGIVDRRYWGIHFEIRQSGKPVNPLNYLR